MTTLARVTVHWLHHRHLEYITVKYLQKPSESNKLNKATVVRYGVWLGFLMRPVSSMFSSCSFGFCNLPFRNLLFFPLFLFSRLTIAIIFVYTSRLFSSGELWDSLLQIHLARASCMWTPLLLFSPAPALWLYFSL